MIRVLIVTDVRLYREGLALVLGRRDDVRVVATAATRAEAIASAAAAPDVILLDMAMPESLATVRDIIARNADQKVVALDVVEDDPEVVAVAEAGIASYVPRDASLEELIRVLEGVARGEAQCSPRVAATLLQRLAALASGQSGLPTGASLTAREHEIIRLIDRGLSNKEIARSLGIEVATVKNHVHNLLEKLQVHRRGEAAARVRRGSSLRQPLA